MALHCFGGGHTWPSAWGNMDISASEEIWKFFSDILNNYDLQ